MIAREGLPIILGLLVLTIVLILAAVRLDNKALFTLSVIFGLGTIFSLFFFRDPPRSCVPEPGLLIAPADGKVVVVEPIGFHPFVNGEAVQISIFLSVFDVHVNRVPADGTVEYAKYNPGKFLAAYEDKASEVNEQTEIGITTALGHRIVCKQIAGLIARRIVCYLNKGDTASKNELKKLPGFVSGEDAVKPGTDQLTCLETMERLNSDFLPVVDEKLKYVGMVERNKITTSLIIDVTRAIEGAGGGK